MLNTLEKPFSIRHHSLFMLMTWLTYTRHGTWIIYIFHRAYYYFIIGGEFVRFQYYNLWCFQIFKNAVGRLGRSCHKIYNTIISHGRVPTSWFPAITELVTGLANIYIIHGVPKLYSYCVLPVYDAYIFFTCNSKH